MKNITVIGAGTMGNGITHAFAQKGYQVIMVDISQDSLDNAMKTIEKNLDRMLTKEKISLDQKNETLNNISLSTSLENSVLDCDLVVEAATENVDLKLKIFNELDLLCPEKTILASNTSSISITEIAHQTKRKDKIIGMHFMNPVPIMKLVEIINGDKTSDATNTAVVEASQVMGKTALSCNDFPGFVSNRILCPMLNEAILTLQEGVAQPEAIDGIMKLGMNHPIGPLALCDLIGLDTVLHIMNVLHDGFGTEKYAPAPLLIEMVNDGKLGRKTGQGFFSY